MNLGLWLCVSESVAEQPSNLEDSNMRKFARFTLMCLALSSVALAAPSFMFSTDAKMNLMAMGNTIDITAYPALKLVSHKETGSSAVLVFAGRDAVGAYAFYDKALKSEGWKDSPDGMMMKEDTMMKDTMMKDTMKKDDTMMNKDTMMKDTMKKDDAMMSKVTKEDMMMAEKMKMKDGTYHGFYVMGKNVISLTTRNNAGRVTVTLTVK
jgi:hypothetical protein